MNENFVKLSSFDHYLDPMERSYQGNWEISLLVHLATQEEVLLEIDFAEVIITEKERGTP